MPLSGRLYGTIGFGYLGCVAALAVLLVTVGCVLDRVGRSSRLGVGYDAAVVALVAGILRPVDLIPVAGGPPPHSAESTAPADELV